jgi:PEGA domain protein
MKKIILLFSIVLLSTLWANAQNFSIKGITKLPTDMDARVNFARKDQNGRTCAIIKIVTPLTGFSFDTGTLSVQYVVEKTGEIWLYVQPGIKKITIAHQTLGVVREWDIPIKIEEACSYALLLDTDEGDALSPQIENPQRIVLFPLRKNEILCTGECFLAFKSDGYHYTCITSDTLLKKKYLVFDGTKKIIADEIEASYLDPCDYSKSIFQYKEDNEWHFYIEGDTYGPYNAERACIESGWESSNCSWIKKGLYGLYNDHRWNWYFRGKPYKNEYGTDTECWYYKDFISDTIVSMNNKYKVFSNEFGTIIFNTLKYRILPKQKFDDDWRQDLRVLDDGRCIIGYWQKDHPYRKFIFEKGKVMELSANQFFNYRTNRVESENEDYGIFMQCVYSYPSYKKNLRVLYDSSEKHTLETCGLYNYVLIDNKEYGRESAIYVHYDKERNEFQWTALEGKELVMYRFRL